MPEDQETNTKNSDIGTQENPGLSIKLSPEQEEKLSSYVETIYGEANNARQVWIRQTQQDLKLYYGHRDPVNFPFKNASNLHIPLTRIIKETLQANLVGSFDFEKPLSVKPRGPEDVKNADKTNKFLNWQFKNEIPWFSLVDESVDVALVFKRAPVKIRYVQETEFNPETNQVEVVFDGVKLDVVPAESVLVPADAVNIDVDKMDYIFHEFYKSKSELIRREKSGLYKNVEASWTSVQDQGDGELIDQVRDTQIGITRKLSDSQKSSVLECYLFYDVNNDGIDESIVITKIKGSKNLLRADYWNIPRPIRFVRVSPVHNKADGESVMDFVGEINKELDTLHNQRVDAVTLSNAPWGFYDPMSGFDPDKVELVPGAMYPTNGPPSQAVYFPSMQSVRPEFYQEENLLVQYAERILGAGVNAQGTINRYRTSATEVANVDRGQGIRFLILYNRLKRDLSDIVKVVLAYNKKFFPPEKQVRVMGVDGGPIFESFKKEDFFGKFDIFIEGNSIIDRQLDKQEQLSRYQLAISNPLVVTNADSLYEITKQTMEVLGDEMVSSWLKKSQSPSPRLPEDEHNMMGQGEDIDPIPGEDVEQHIKVHEAFIMSPKFQYVPREFRTKFIMHLQKSRLLRQALSEVREVPSNVGPQNTTGRVAAPSGLGQNYSAPSSNQRG